ncbi:ABC transporter ATP-binding protein [Breznakiella homolactica]|nr:ABC transporter ATP-binding protein [Breznakiella homolactica]
MVIELEGVKRIYQLSMPRRGKKDHGINDQETEVRALRGVDLSVEAGDFVAVRGPSGSGKSTLMNILGCLDKPDEGRYRLDGIETAGLGSGDTAVIRNRKIGFVFQSFNLLPRTTALENVERPLLYRRLLTGEGKKQFSGGRERKDRAAAVLRELGLENRMDHLPSQLSGGQQQRVAIARAMVNDPAFILADEPTGNLDTEMSLEILGIFQDLNRRGKTIIMVTHEPEYAAYCRRIVTLRDGRIVSDKTIPRPADAVLNLKKLREQNAGIEKEES